MPELRCLVSPWIPNGTLTAYLKSNHDDLTVLDRSRMVSNALILILSPPRGSIEIES
jgi:hypothetical protein